MNMNAEPASQTESHEQLVGTIKQAAANMPEGIVTDGPLDGMTTFRTPDGSGFAQLSEDGAGESVVAGAVEAEGSVPQVGGIGTGGNVSKYGFNSIRQGEGEPVAKAAVRRMAGPSDAVTRAGSVHHADSIKQFGGAKVYEHGFTPEASQKVGELATELVIRKAQEAAQAPEAHDRTA